MKQTSIIFIFLRIACGMQRTVFTNSLSNALESLLIKLISDGFDGYSCTVVYNDNDDTNVQLNLGSHIFPIIHIRTNVSQSSNKIYDISLEAINHGCGQFIIESLDVEHTMLILKQTFQIAVQRGGTRYVIVIVDNAKDIYKRLANDLIQFFPYLYLLNRKENSAGDTSEAYDILTHTLGNNLTFKSFRVAARWRDFNFTNVDGLKEDKLQNLGGITLQLLWWVYPPFTMRTEDGYDGTDYRIAVELSRKYNFTWNFHNIEYVGWGHAADNLSAPSFNGYLKTMKFQASVPGDYLTMTTSQFFDQSYPYIKTSLAFLTPKAKRQIYMWSIFTPFTNSLWFLTVAYILCCSLLLHYFTLLSKSILRQKLFYPYLQFSYSLLNSISIVVGVALPHAEYFAIKHIITCSFFTSTLLITAYNCNLVSFLTFPRYKRPIDTLQEFVDSNLQWGTEEIGWTYYFSEQHDELLKAVSERHLIVKDFQELNALATNGKIALIVDKLVSGHINNIFFIDDSTLENLHLMRENILTFNVVFDFPKGSPIIKLFNRHIQLLRDSGIILKWQKDVMFKLQSGKDLYLLSAIEKEPRPLRMEDLQGSFILIIIGYALSTLMFVVEHMIFILMRDRR